MMLGVISYTINNNQYIAPRFEGHRFDNLLPFGHVPTIKVELIMMMTSNIR